MATVGACTAFGAICGSGPATSATMALVALPEMKRYGYNMELACGTVASGGTLGMMIPPSVVFIVYGIMTEQSIGKLFISGILPGLLTAAIFCVVDLHQRASAARTSARPPRPPPGAPSSRPLLGVTETLAAVRPGDRRHVRRASSRRPKGRPSGRAARSSSALVRRQLPLADALASAAGNDAHQPDGHDHRGRGDHLRPVPGRDAASPPNWRPGWAACPCRRG